MEKTYVYESGTVTVHGLEHWPQERFVPILTEYVSAICNGEEEKESVA